MASLLQTVMPQDMQDCPHQAQVTQDIAPAPEAQDRGQMAVPAAAAGVQQAVPEPVLREQTALQEVVVRQAIHLRWDLAETAEVMA